MAEYHDYPGSTDELVDATGQMVGLSSLVSAMPAIVRMTSLTGAHQCKLTAVGRRSIFHILHRDHIAALKALRRDQHGVDAMRNQELPDRLGSHERKLQVCLPLEVGPDRNAVGIAGYNYPRLLKGRDDRSDPSNGLRRVGRHFPTTGRKKPFAIYSDFDGIVQLSDVYLLQRNLAGKTSIKLLIIAFEEVAARMQRAV